MPLCGTCGTIPRTGSKEDNLSVSDWLAQVVHFALNRPALQSSPELPDSLSIPGP